MADDIMATFEKQLESANVPQDTFETLPEENLNTAVDVEQDLVKSFEEQLEGKPKAQKVEKQTTEQFKNSTGALLGLKSSELTTGSPAFKQALRGRVDDAEEPSLLGGVQEVGQTFLEAGKNIPASAGKLGMDIFNAITSPIETAKSIGGLGLGLVQKLIPGEQESEIFVDALVNNYKERYGSLDAIQETFINDPVGFMSDTAGILLAGGGVIKGAGAVAKLEEVAKLGGKIGKAGALVDPLTGLAKVGKVPAKGLVKSAEKGIEKVLAPTKEITKAKTAKVLPALTQERIKAFSTEGFQKQIKTKLTAVGKEFDDFLETTGVKGSTKTKQLTDVLENAKENFKVGETIVEPKSIKIIEGLQETLKSFGDDIPNTELRNLRQIWDKSVAKGKRFDVAKTADVLDELDFKKMVTDSIREELAKTNPELAKLNKKFAFYKNVDDVLSETLKRRTGQAGGLGKKLAFIGGLATGDGIVGRLVTAQALKSLIATMESTAWRTVSSDLKLKLAESLTTGNKTNIANILRQIEKTKED